MEGLHDLMRDPQRGRDIERERALMRSPAGRLRLAIESALHSAQANDAEAAALEATATEHRQLAETLRQEAEGFTRALAVLEDNGFREPAPLSVTVDSEGADA